MHNLITAIEFRLSNPACMADTMMFVSGLAVGVLLVLGALSIFA